MIKITETSDHLLLAALNKEVQALHHTLYPKVFKPYDKESVSGFFKEALNSKNAKAFIAVNGEQAVGYTLLFEEHVKENPFQYQRTYLLLDQLLVTKEMRGKGIAKLLMDTAINYAKSKNITTVELNHWTLNNDARAFFQKNGFKYHNEKMHLEINM